MIAIVDNFGPDYEETATEETATEETVAEETVAEKTVAEKTVAVPADYLTIYRYFTGKITSYRQKEN